MNAIWAAWMPLCERVWWKAEGLKCWSNLVPQLFSFHIQSSLILRHSELSKHIRVITCILAQCARSPGEPPFPMLIHASLTLRASMERCEVCLQQKAWSRSPSLTPINYTQLFSSHSNCQAFCFHQPGNTLPSQNWKKWWWSEDINTCLAVIQHITDSSGHLCCWVGVECEASILLNLQLCCCIVHTWSILAHHELVHFLLKSCDMDIKLQLNFFFTSTSIWGEKVSAQTLELTLRD